MVIWPSGTVGICNKPKEERLQICWQMKEYTAPHPLFKFPLYFTCTWCIQAETRFPISRASFIAVLTISHIELLKTAPFDKISRSETHAYTCTRLDLTGIFWSQWTTALGQLRSQWIRQGIWTNKYKRAMQNKAVPFHTKAAKKMCGAW